MARDVPERVEGVERLELAREPEDSIPDPLPHVRRRAESQSEEGTDGRRADPAVGIARQSEQPTRNLCLPPGRNRGPEHRQRPGGALPDVGVVIGNHSQ